MSIDPSLARPWHELAAIALDADRPRDGIDAARAAARAAPHWWAPPLLLARAFTARGLDFDAGQALARGDTTPIDQIPCATLDAMRGQARERRELAREARLETALVACGGNVEVRVDRLRARGELAAARTLLRATLVLEPGRQDLVTDLATVLAAEGNHAEAIAELTALVARDPNDPCTAWSSPTRRSPPGARWTRVRRSPRRSPRGPTSPRCCAPRARCRWRCRWTNSVSTGARRSARSKRRQQVRRRPP